MLPFAVLNTLGFSSPKAQALGYFFLIGNCLIIRSAPKATVLGNSNPIRPTTLIPSAYATRVATDTSLSFRPLL